MNAVTPKRGTALVKARAGQSRRRELWSKAVAPLFHRLIDRIDKGLDCGTFEARLPDGTLRIVGARGPGPTAEITIVRWNALARLVRFGSIGWYRAWEAGEWTSPDPVPVFDLFTRNRAGLNNTGRASGLARVVAKSRHARRRNDRLRARENVQYHYDLGNDFYAAWLDETMSYSSAMFGAESIGTEHLAAAQARKADAMIARLGTKPGDEVLEIGAGWGWLGGRMAREHGLAVTGISLSEEQTAWARAHHPEAQFHIRDYRDVAGQFDAIVSVEMVEAVGQRYWPEFVDTLARSLKPGARAALQYISIADDIFDAYAGSADFIQTYIFPGGMLLSQSRFRALAEERGLAWQDQVEFGHDYAETLKHWRNRFDAAVEAGHLPSGFDAHFVDLWRYYLMYCEGGFRGGGITVSQVTLVKQ